MMMMEKLKVHLSCQQLGKTCCMWWWPNYQHMYFKHDAHFAILISPPLITTKELLCRLISEENSHRNVTTFTPLCHVANSSTEKKICLLWHRSKNFQRVPEGSKWGSFKMVVRVAAACSWCKQWSREAHVGRILTSPFVMCMTEIWTPVQSHSGECHQCETAGRRLPVVSEGRMAVKLAC